MTALAQITRKLNRRPILSFATIALIIGLTAGCAYSQADWTQSGASEPAAVSDRIGAAPASRIVPCLMPAAWRRGCAE